METRFAHPSGHYQYKVLPFGFLNVPATFKAMMNTILAEYLDQRVEVYLDDIPIYSKIDGRTQGSSLISTSQARTQ